MARRSSPPPARATRPAPALPPPRSAPAPVPPAEVEVFEEMEQGSEEWTRVRLGTPTASVFKTIMATGRDDEESRTRALLMRQLAGEILTGLPAEGRVKTAAMERGTSMEPRARAYYERRHFVDVQRIGFVRRRLPSGRWAGASPDGIIDGKRVLEIKSLAPHLMIERLLNGAAMPSEHRAQVHGTLWIGDYEEADLILYYDGMPVTPQFSVRRDETFIKEIARAVEVFDFELHQLVNKIRAMGAA